MTGMPRLKIRKLLGFFFSLRLNVVKLQMCRTEAAEVGRHTSGAGLDGTHPLFEYSPHS